MGLIIKREINGGMVVNIDVPVLMAVQDNTDVIHRKFVLFGK